MKKIDYIRSRKKMYAKRTYLFLALVILFFVARGFLEKFIPIPILIIITALLVIGTFLNLLVYADLMIFEIPFSSKRFSQMKKEFEEELTADTKQEIDNFGYMTALRLFVKRM